MIREHETMLRRLLVVVDLSIIILTFFVGYHLRDALAGYSDDLKGMYSFHTYVNLLPHVLILWISSLYAIGAYQQLRIKSEWNVLLDITKAGFIAILFFGSFAFLSKLHYLSRIFILIVFILTWILLAVERVIMLRIVHNVIKKGYDTREILLVGTGPRAQKFINLVHAHPEWGFKFAGLVDKDPRLKGETICGEKVIGSLSELSQLLNDRIVDEVVIIVPRDWLGAIEDSILYCEQLGKRVSVAVDLFNLRFARSKLIDLQNFPLMTFETTSDKLWQLLIKRILDFLIAAAAIVVLSPVLLAVALVVKMSSRGPAIFKQVRCGLNGRKFTVYKFRTMVIDAEARLEALQKHNEMSGPAFKMTDDPRIIRFGKILRKFSLDELPQLFNVLEGNMSIVGPRPPIPAEVAKYSPWQMRRLSMRPGLTCIWQVQGRNKIVKFNEWMKLDLLYIDTWSLWLDLKLFLQTIPIVLFGIGAK